MTKLHSDPTQCDEDDDFFELLFGEDPDVFESPKGQLSEPLFNKDALRQSWQHRSDKERECFNSFLNANHRKKLVDTSSRTSQLEALRQNFPNFCEVIDFYEGQLAISWRTGMPLNISPVNLQGPPGIGKTVFVEALAVALNLEFFDLQISGMHAEFELVGGNGMWAKASAGAIATTLILRAETYHPVILLDEICLLSKNDKVDMFHPLYGVLDKEQAGRFHDQYLDTTVDASHAVYITTTNNIEKLPEAIRSRLTCFNIRPPSYAESLALVPKILHSVLTELGLGDCVDEALPEQALKALAHSAPREVKLHLKNAAGQALRRDRTSEVIQFTLADFQMLPTNNAPMPEASELIH